MSFKIERTYLIAALVVIMAAAIAAYAIYWYNPDPLSVPSNSTFACCLIEGNRLRYCVSTWYMLDKLNSSATDWAHGANCTSEVIPCVLNETANNTVVCAGGWWE